MFAKASQEYSSCASSGGWNGTPNASAKMNSPKTLATKPPDKMIVPSRLRSGESFNLMRITKPSRNNPAPKPRSPIMKPKKSGNVRNRTKVGSTSL